MEINKPVIIAIILMAIGLSVWLFVFPKYEEFTLVKIELAQKQGEYDGRSLYYEKISEIIKSIEDRQEVLDKVDASLSSGSSIAPLIYFFQQKGSETGMIIRSITFSNPTSSDNASKPSKPNTKKEVKEITFAISLVGNYQGLKSFLAGLERSARLLEVDVLTLTPLQLSQTPGKLQTYDFKLQVKTHIY